MTSLIYITLSVSIATFKLVTDSIINPTYFYSAFTVILVHEIKTLSGTLLYSVVLANTQA